MWCHETVAPPPWTGDGSRMPAPDRLSRSATQPLWQQLLVDLRSRLDRGEFAAQGFPGELELVGEYGVSRHTVREALRRLRADGVVVAGRGRRPRVRVIAQPACILYSLFATARDRGLSHMSVVRALDIRADGTVATKIGLEESTPLFHLERLRLIDGEPLALDRVWLPAAIGEPLLSADFRHTSFYSTLLDRTSIPVTGGEETIRATIPTPVEYDLLDMTPPTPAFLVHRLGTSRGMPIEWRQTLIRADRFALVSQLGVPASTSGLSPDPRGVLGVTPTLM